MRGFVLDGERVPLLGPQGVFKPRVLEAIPLSITTVPVVEGESRPYDDAFGPEGLLRVPLSRVRTRDITRTAACGWRCSTRCPWCASTASCPALRRRVARLHGLQGFHGTSLLLPRVPALRPAPVLLEARYERFRQAG